MKTHTLNIQKNIYQEIMSWFKKTDHDDTKFHKKFDELAKQYGNIVFSVLFNIIANLHFQDVKAKSLWNKVWIYKEKIENRLNRNVDFRVALLDYLLEVNHKLKSPKIIEISVFEKTQKSIILDELTNLFNYRFFINQMNYEIAINLRYNLSFCILFIDLDNFKQINDSFGHEEGNKVLVKFAEILNTSIRKSDLAFRYGGDEFVIILHNITKTHCLAIAEKLRNNIVKTPVKLNDTNYYISISAGIASYPLDAKTCNTLIDKADSALQQSKIKGKNCVTLYSTHSRMSKRVPIKKTIHLLSFDDVEKKVDIYDVSLTGISFICNQPIKNDQYFKILLGEKVKVSFLVKTIRTQVINNKYLVGTKFIDLQLNQIKFIKNFNKSKKTISIKTIS